MFSDAPSKTAAPTARLAKGTPVVSLDNGATLGEIDHVYFDPERLAVVGFTFHQGGGLFGGARCSGLVDIVDVHAFGADAVTVDDVSVIRGEVAMEARRSELLDLESLLQRTVMTDLGTRVGKVAAIQFGDASYRLTALAVTEDGGGETMPIAAADIQTIGKEWIIVADPSAAVLGNSAPRRPLRVVTTHVPARAHDGSEREVLGA